DEGRPSCQRCVKYGKAEECVYPLDRKAEGRFINPPQSSGSSSAVAHMLQLAAMARFPPASSVAESDGSTSEAESEDAKTSRAWRAVLTMQQTETPRKILGEYANLVLPTDLAPQEWDFVEGVEYCMLANPVQGVFLSVIDAICQHACTQGMPLFFITEEMTSNSILGRETTISSTGRPQQLAGLSFPAPSPITSPPCAGREVFPYAPTTRARWHISGSNTVLLWRLKFAC
ncbi:MAG: Zn(II)2Cys6 transcription factor domain-containing protein, partial [Candidatus Binatia bacterium]